MEQGLYRGVIALLFTSSAKWEIVPDSCPIPSTDEDVIQSEQDYLRILRDQDFQFRRFQNIHMPVPAPHQAGVFQGDGPPFIPPQGNFSLTENGRIVTTPSD